MARTTGQPGVSVSQKVFAVLDCFDQGSSVLSLTEVSRMTGLPLSTTRRLILELCDWGGLERAGMGGYRVGMRLWQIGSGAPSRKSLREAAYPVMQDLYQASRENVQLIVLDGLEALCVEKIYGRKAFPTETGVGERMPLHATAAGKALLAFSPPGLAAEAIAHGLQRCTPRTLIEPGRLASALRATRKQGLAYSQEERTYGAVSVASPILASSGQLHGAVAVVARVGTNMLRLGPAVRTAALSIGRSLG